MKTVKPFYAVNNEQIETTHSQGKFTAMFIHPQPYFVNGTPMGRGTSYESAITDLIRRVNYDFSHSHTMVRSGSHFENLRNIAAQAGWLVNEMDSNTWDDEKVSAALKRLREAFIQDATTLPVA